MKTANSFKISSSCWQLTIKAFVVQIVFVSIVVALCFMFFSGLASEIINVWNELDLAGFVGETISAIAEGQFNGQEFAIRLEETIANVTQAISEMPNIFNRIEVSYIILVATLCIFRIMNSLADIPVVFSLNEFMTTNAKRPFIWYFFKKMGKSLVFVLVQFAIAFPLDVILVFAVIGFYLLFLVTFKWWTIFPAVVVAVFLYALRVSIFSFWLPSIAVNDSKIVDGLKNNFSKLPGHFWSVFLQTFVTIALMLVVLAIGMYSMSVQASAIISAVVSILGFYQIKCFNMVQYFEANKLPYFATRVNIAGLSKKGGLRRREN